METTLRLSPEMAGKSLSFDKKLFFSRIEQAFFPGREISKNHATVDKIRRRDRSEYININPHD